MPLMLHVVRAFLFCMSICQEIGRVTDMKTMKMYVCIYVYVVVRVSTERHE